MVIRDVAKRSAVRMRVTFVVLRRPGWGLVLKKEPGLGLELLGGSDWPLLKLLTLGVAPMRLRVGLPLL